MSEENELPKGWVQTTLGEVTAPMRVSVQPADYPTLPFIGMEHVEAETMRLLGTVPASELKSNAVRFWSGDVLYGRLRSYLNKVFRPDFEGLCSGEFLVFRDFPNLDSRYLQYFLNSWSFKEFASHLNEGDRPRVDWDQLKSFSFPLAPLSEQHCIVAAIEQQFSRLDASVAALQRARTKLKRYRAAVLKAAVEGKLTETWRAEHPTTESAGLARKRILADVTEAVPHINAKRRLWGAGHVTQVFDEIKAALPATWELCKVRDLGPESDNIVQIGPMSMKSSEFTTEGIPVLNVGCVKWGYFDLSKLDFLPLELASKFERYRLKAGDVIFTRSGTIGRCAIARKEHDNWLITFHLLRVRVEPRICLSEYLMYVFEGAPHVREQITSASIGSTRAGFNTRLLEELDIPLPPIEEQEQIVAEVERRLSVINQLEATVEANLKRAERLRQSILREAFTGRLVPQDPNDEPASVLLERIRSERSEQSNERKNGVGASKSSRGGAVKVPEPEKVDVTGVEQVELWEQVGN